MYVSCSLLCASSYHRLTVSLCCLVFNPGEADIDAVKEKIKSAVDMYKDNWRKVSNGDSKRRKHQKRKLKSQLLRLEGMIDAQRLYFTPFMYSS